MGSLLCNVSLGGVSSYGVLDGVPMDGGSLCGIHVDRAPMGGVSLGVSPKGVHLREHPSYEVPSDGVPHGGVP